MRDVQFTANPGDRSDVQNIVVVITDGESNIDQATTLTEAQTVQDAGITMYSIGVNNAVDMAEVSGMSSQPRVLNQNYWLVVDFASLNAVADDIASAICVTGRSVVEGKLGCYSMS